MELRNVRTFVSVAGLLSFRRAAAVLNYAPSTVSAQIQSLEDELRLKLFDRLEKGIRLTEAGERFLPYALKLQELAAESVSAAAGEHARKGMLTVRMPETLAAYRFPGVLSRFRQEHPNIGIRLRGSSTHNIQRYLEKGLDLAFVVGEARPWDNCHIERIGSEAFVLVGHSSEWGSGRVAVTASDFAGRLALSAASDSSNRVVLERGLARKNAQENVWIDFSSLSAIRNSLLAGREGCALLPRSAVRQDILSGVLAELVLDGVPEELPVHMLWHREKWISPPLEFFMQLCRDIWTEAVSS